MYVKGAASPPSPPSHPARRAPGQGQGMHGPLRHTPGHASRLRVLEVLTTQVTTRWSGRRPLLANVPAARPAGGRTATQPPSNGDFTITSVGRTSVRSVVASSTEENARGGDIPLQFAFHDQPGGRMKRALHENAGSTSEFRRSDRACGSLGQRAMRRYRSQEIQGGGANRGVGPPNEPVEGQTPKMRGQYILSSGTVCPRTLGNPHGFRHELMIVVASIGILAATPSRSTPTSRSGARLARPRRRPGLDGRQSALLAHTGPLPLRVP